MNAVRAMEAAWVKAALHAPTVKAAAHHAAAREATTDCPAPTDKEHLGRTASYRGCIGGNGPYRHCGRNRNRPGQNWKNSHDNLLSHGEVGGQAKAGNQRSAQILCAESCLVFCRRTPAWLNVT
jgi:hypothetical protein